MSQNELSGLRMAVQRNPQDFIAWVMLADMELDAGDTQAGLAAAQRALTLRPEHPEALARLGRAHWAAGRHAQAVPPLQHASALAPGHPGMALWLGHALEDIGEAEAAAQAYERDYRLMPQEAAFAAYLLNWRRKLCDWRDLDRLATTVRIAIAQGNPAIEPFAFLNEDGSALEQLACARSRAMQIASTTQPLPPAAVRTQEKLRLGFVSNGFGAHPTGLLTVAFFEALAADQGIDIHLFATNADDGSVIRERLDKATTLHGVAGFTHEAIATHIRAADMDILYDLRGWGGGGTPEVFARRPAPVQVNWLAYPGTSGAPWMDYVLADRYVLPQSMATAFSESVAWLPRCFQPSDTKRQILETPTRHECGLPEQGVVFACFNNSYKLNPSSFSRMLQIIAGVPGSVLWLLSGPGHADARLRDATTTSGIDPSRIICMQKLPHADYLARYQHVDLFLDTAPYNAHTTASDALWAGCPVLTLPGQTFAARVAGSLNHHLGLPHMNMENAEAFIATAIQLGRNPTALTELRQALEQCRNQSGLFDMAGFAQDFAATARAMAMNRRINPASASFG